MHIVLARIPGKEEKEIKIRLVINTLIMSVYYHYITILYNIIILKRTVQKKMNY